MKKKLQLILKNSPTYKLRDVRSFTQRVLKATANSYLKKRHQCVAAIFRIDFPTISDFGQKYHELQTAIDSRPLRAAPAEFVDEYFGRIVP
uniref:AlNc14C36G3226 protein n=1 Tax=Albugo laibachii Nc14 TaxID=890382 RepID=F0W8V2_9STRA|nr:AlNc14C36G3226 [Albugo laibachii Nc14]CCA27845.1 AlNc14C735G12463 [Albugo laibachii Nc14]|eukprot:CCA27845.1 AlNc14C735G12463 [Albugo laibachii Nc14]